MKFKKPTIIFSLLILFILTSVGIFISVRAMQSQQQDTLMARTETGQPPIYKNHSTARRNYPSELIYLSTTHFEPLLLFMLGAGLLLIVTGIKMIHSRKHRLELDSASPTAARTNQPLRLPKGKRVSSP